LRLCYLHRAAAHRASPSTYTLSLHDALPISPEIKDPNDLLIGGRKVAGVLAEAREERVVLGIGINVNIEAADLPQAVDMPATSRSEEHTSELQSRSDLVCRLLLEKKKTKHHP